MLFPTLTFAVFFAVVFGLNWGLAALAERYAGCERGLVSLRKLVLLAASLVFYGWWSWPFALMLLASSVINHGFALWMAGRGEQAGRLPVALAVALNIGVLVFFKYTGFLFNGAVAPLGVKVAGWLGRGDAWIAFLESAQPFLDMIVLPVGISFYTFQALSYVIDVARGEIKPARRWIDFANYLAFFPQLVAGPIVRASHLIPAMENLPGTETRLDTARAGVLILVGLFKKMVIADYLAANLADPLFAMPEEFGTIDALMGVYAYTLQIYCDFSAYSDIAIGCALLLGFEFPINFDAPYFSDSFKTFWRRWHISLSSWLRDYLYIPLGGSRRGKARTYANLMLTMFLGAGGGAHARPPRLLPSAEVACADIRVPRGRLPVDSLQGGLRRRHGDLQGGPQCVHGRRREVHAAGDGWRGGAGGGLRPAALRRSAARLAHRPRAQVARVGAGRPGGGRVYHHPGTRPRRRGSVHLFPVLKEAWT